MKLSTLFLVTATMLLPHVCQAQIVDIDSARRSGGKFTLTGYRNTLFLDVPRNLQGKSFRIQNGILQISEDQQSWQEADQKLLPHRVTGDWNQFDLLGAVGLENTPISLQHTLKGFKWDTLGLGKDEIIEIGTQSITNTITPIVSIYGRKIDGQTNTFLSSFQVNSDPFFFRPGMAFFLNHHIIAILVGTNHPDVNFIIFYDLEQKKPVSFTSFSSIKYNPIAETMDFGQPLPNSIARTTREEDIKVTTVPLFVGKNLNPEFQEISGFIQAQQ